MSKGPEGRYIDKIHRQLDPRIYKMKMNMGMGAPIGIPDYYYEGDKTNLWIEYKVLQTPSWNTTRKIPYRQITASQKLWIKRAYKNNQKVYVIMGDKDGNGIVINPYTLEHPQPLSYHTIKSPKEIAEEIACLVLAN